MSFAVQHSIETPSQEDGPTEITPSLQLADPSSPTRSECISQGYPNLPLGKQCSHPANVWFRDPRESAPALQPQATILREVFQSYTSMDAYYRATFASYEAHVEAIPPTPNDREEERDTVKATTIQHTWSFPQFMRLPLEIRWQIWQLAIPSRIINIGQLQMLDPIDIRNLTLHVPLIARVCREARQATLRMGTKLTLRRNVSGTLQKLPAGFVTPYDIPFYSYGSINVEQLKEEKAHTADGVTAVTADLVAEVVGCKVAAVHWPSPMQTFTERSRYPANFLASKVREWNFLRDCNLETLLVLFRAPISLHLELDLGYYSDQLEKEKLGSLAENVEGAVTQLLVDLYDDQLLAELTSLEIGRSDNDQPRYMADYVPQNLGLCLNCERVQWEQYHRAWVEYFWLSFYSCELDNRELEIVFPEDGIYKPDHPWVQEKLCRAPQFRPAVFFYLHFDAE